MENFTVIRQGHLNHYGYLFGGQMLSWVDEFCWIVASREFPNDILVTRAMDNIEFTTQAGPGSILRFDINFMKKSKTSVKYTVEVYAMPPESSDERKVFSTHVIFVSVDKNGNKCPLK